MNLSIARYLKDFSEPQGSALTLAATDSTDDIFGDHGLSDTFGAPPAVDVDEERRIAWAEGHEAGVQEANAQAEARLQEVIAAHEAAIAALEARHVEESSQKITSGLRKSADAVASAISEQVAAVLAPVMHEEVSARAVSTLAAAIRAAMPDGEAVTLLVHGPRALFERLEAEPGMQGALKFVESDDLDLVVEIADSVLVSRLSAWSASLGKVME